MRLIEVFEESITILTTNKMRTGLSALGIIIGISAVITLMTLGQASQQQVENRIKSLGSNLLTISSSRDAATQLSNDDLTAILENTRINTTDKAAGEYSTQAQLAYEDIDTKTSVYGISDNYFEIRNIEISSGRTLTETDTSLISKVAIIGPDIATELFGNTTAIGNNLKINGITFTVVGITKEKGQTGRSNMDEAVYIPITTAQKVVFGGTNLTSIYVTAIDEASMKAAQNQLGYLLLEEHRIENVEDADFTITSQEDLLETVGEVTGTFTTLLTGIAAISLLVGGIGIMNIMLVTVTERTREIGIRKALGAKRKTIVTQFLVESIILTITGGIVGVTIGIGASMLVTNLMGLPSTLSYESIGLAVLVSCTIGILFGWYPAQKAAKLQPIEALRYE
jgi:putative ABC transport system permease protein